MWQNGHRTALGAGFRAAAINDNGWVAGTISTDHKDKNGHPIRHAALWRNGHVLDLTPLDTTHSSTAVDVNNTRQVLLSDEDTFHVWEDGRMHLLLSRVSLGIFSEPIAINDTGVLLYNGNDDQAISAHFYDGNKIIETRDKEWMGDEDTSSGTALNNRGQFVGFVSRHAGGTDGFLWNKGQIQTLAGLVPSSLTRPTASIPHDLNDAGQIVGDCEPTDTPGEGGGIIVGHAFTIPLCGIGDDSRRAWWCPNAGQGHLYDLNFLIPAGTGWTLTDAYSINNRGQIAGFGLLHGVRHIFLLTPKVAVNASSRPVRSR